MSGFYINSIRGRHCQQKQTIAGRIEQHAAWEDENLIFITNRKCVMVLMIGRINECCECCCSTAGVADAVLLYETGWFNSGSSNQTKSLAAAVETPDDDDTAPSAATADECITSKIPIPAMKDSYCSSIQIQ